MEHIKVNSVSEAWRTAARIFPTDYEKNEESSKRAGYPIYETTSTDGRFSGFHISDLNTRLEVNMGAETVTGFCVILFNVKEPEQQEKETEEIQAEVMQNPETMTQTAENIEDKYKVFDTMSEDWGSDDLEGFVFYDLPEQYADKGYFPEKMQIYTRCLCKQYDVPYALVLAIIEQESGYEFDKTGDGGQSKGYMQIYEKWHTDRMQKLGCTDLMNP